jgi:hypothetical protein
MTTSCAKAWFEKTVLLKAALASNCLRLIGLEV